MKYIVFLFALIFSSPAWAALAIDGQAAGTTSAALVTTKSNDIIICHFKSTGSTTLSDNGPNLTYTLRAGTTLGFEAYAIASAPFNATISSGASHITCFGISGANTVTPFDVNASLPAINSAGGGSTSLGPASPISTTAANTMLLAFIEGDSSSLGTITEPSGFSSTGATGTSVIDSSYHIVSSSQSSISPTYSYTTAASSHGVWDAVQAASGATAQENVLMSVP
jgi:hypothetical protein